MQLFRCKKYDYDPVESRFDAIMALIKDLERADYNRLKSAMDSCYDGYQKVKKVKTQDEKEVAAVDEIEKELKKEVTNGRN